MKRLRFTEEQIIAVLRDLQSAPSTGARRCHSPPRATSGHVVRDNGTELTSNAILSWADETAVGGTTSHPENRNRTASLRASTARCATSC
jgi:hypothetical protein